MLSEVLRPRTIGDILDATIRLYRRHFLLYFGIALCVQVVTFVASLAYVIPWSYVQPRGFTPGATGMPDFTAFAENPLLLVTFCFGVVFGIGVYIVGAQLQRGALIVAVSQTFLGDDATVGDAFSAVLQRFWTLFGFGLLSTALVFGTLVGGMAVGAVPIALASQFGGAVRVIAVLFGLSIMFGAFVGMLYLMLALILGPQAIMLEGAGVTEALSRSWYMMRDLHERGLFSGNIVRVGFILTIIGLLQAMVIGVVTVLVSVTFGLITVFLGKLDIAVFQDMSPLVLQLPLNLLQSVLGAAVLPLGLIALILFYYDVRIRFEGFDIEVLAGALDPR